jgi:hypothetical protein
MGRYNDVQPDPRYFDFGNAFMGGMQQSRENNRRDQMVDLERQQQQFYQQRIQQQMAMEQAQMQAQQQQSAASKEQYRKVFEQVGLDPGLADTEGADELFAHIMEQSLAPPEQPKLIEDHTGALVPEAPGVRPYHEPKAPAAPKGPGTLYQVMGPDGKPMFVPAEQAVGQQPFVKPKDDKSANVQTGMQLWETALQGLREGLGGTNTGPIAGRIPAFTAAQQRAESSVAALAPVLKQIFRVAGEGTFTDRDQAMLLDMIPTRKVDEAAREDVIANIDRIVRAKLAVPGAQSSSGKRIVYDANGKRVQQ